MVTKEQALTSTEFHWGDCRQTVGPRGGRGRLYQEVWRKNGATKTWKTRPNEWRVPIKHGLYRYAYLTHREADQFHTAMDCPLLKGDPCDGDDAN